MKYLRQKNKARWWCNLDNKICDEDKEGFGRCGDLISECLKLGKSRDLPLFKYGRPYICCKCNKNIMIGLEYGIIRNPPEKEFICGDCGGKNKLPLLKYDGSKKCRRIMKLLGKFIRVNKL